MVYKSLGEYLQRLEEEGELIRVKRRINKDTELMPLVRWQFRGLTKEQRKAFWFDNVVDAKGRKYDMPVGVGLLGASGKIYRRVSPFPAAIQPQLFQLLAWGARTLTRESATWARTGAW